MMEFGKTLRTAREAKGLTTGQIAERTHMMVQVVEGLENEDFSKIVAPIYGRGFVKLYCETVGLEPKPLVDAFMEIYSGGRGKSAAPHEPAKPEPRQVEPAAPESPPKPIAPPPNHVAAEPPQRVQETIDFGAPPAAEVTRQQPTTSRYAAPMPIDDGFSMPAVNWRMVALGAAAVAIVVLALLGVRALYRVTMTAPEEETTEVAAPAPDPAPAPTDARAPAKAPVDRKPLPLKPFYIDSNHQTETENK